MKYSYLLLSIIILTIFILSSCKWEESTVPTNSDAAFSPNGVTAGSNSTYNINLEMTSSEEFKVETNIEIINTSDDNWNELVFYFIPNIFTEKTSQELSYPLTSPGTVSLHEVKIDGEKVKYTLSKDTLKIPLKSGLASKSKMNVNFSYNFTLPEEGLRFTKNNGNFYLAQFYPMLATYRDHSWNKEDYRFKGETYHTGFSDFLVNYQLPEGYTLVSTSPNDTYPSKSKGTLHASKVKMFFISILQNPSIVEKEVNQTNIRVFGFDEEKEYLQDITDLAADVITYFEKTIGQYPYKQLDIVLDGKSMEYPGIVTADSIDNIGELDQELLKKTLVHELAHQWFYGVISNDPYHEAWLDEGFAEFATGLYYYSRPNTKVPYDNLYKMIKNLEPMPVNLPLDEYENNSHIYVKSNVMLWKLFEERGGIEEAEKYLKTYYQYYQFKEVNSEEFIRFTKYYLNLKDNSAFKEWLDIE